VRWLCAGALGAGSGLLIGTVRGQPTVRFAATLGANFALAACCFCGAQELVRELRAADSDDWINGMLGGLASGSVLGYLQGVGRNQQEMSYVQFSNPIAVSIT
jgi:hypothetical protein